MDKEIWKPVFDRYYEASNQGRIRRLSPSGSAEVGRILRPAIVRGYCQVVLYRENKPHSKYVHCLAAEAFMGPKPKNYQVNHKDGIKKNNQLDNLEYVTPSENNLHAYRIGLRLPPIPPNMQGEKNISAKLTLEKVKEIRATYQKFSKHELAEKFKVHPVTIYDVLSRKTWNHVK